MSQLIERSHDEAEAARKAEKALVWKIDLLLMPLLIITYGLQYYDKAILGSAAVFGIIKDLHLSTTSASGVVSTLRYSTANAAFYYGYIVGVLPWALLLQRAPISKTIGFAVFVWGLTALLTVVVKDYHGLVVQRVFLGVVESAVSPGFVLVTSMWYTKEQQASRVGLWYSATGIFSMFSGVVNYGLGSTKGPSPWKAMYYFAGAITMFWALVLVVLLPDSPDRPGRFFNGEERKLLLARARRNQTGLAGKKWNWSQAKEAATDPKIALFLIMGAAIYIVNGGVTAFGARIIQSFGFSSLNTILVAIPGGLVTMVTIYLFGWLAGVWKDARTILIPISCIPVVVGALMIWLASWKNRAVPLVGFYLLASFGAPYVLLLSLSSANVAGATKKSFSNSAIFIGYNVGNIVAPYTIFTPEVKIKYRSTWIAVLVAMGVTSLLSLVLRLWLQRENRRLDALEATTGGSISAAPVAHPSKDSKHFVPGHENETKLGAGEEDDASLNSVIEEDRTEYQIPGFRFVL